MKEATQNRAVELEEYIATHKATVRATAGQFGITKRLCIRRKKHLQN